MGAVAMLACGMTGFYQSYPEHYRGLPLLNVLLSLFYSSLQLFFLETFIGPADRISPLLNIARFGAPLLLAITAIKTITVLMEEEIREWKLSHFRGHVVICGLGRKGYEVARQFMPIGNVVIIERDENNDYTGACRDSGALVLIGDAADPQMLKKARADHAREVFFLTGSDGVNFSGMVNLSKLRQKGVSKTAKPKVWLHLNALEMCSFLREGKVLRSVREILAFEIVSLFELAARDLVVNHLVPLLPVRPEASQRFHMFLVGFGRMGQTIVRKLVQTAVTMGGKRPMITVFALDAESDLKRMEGEVPGIRTCCDLEMIAGDILLSSTRAQLMNAVQTSRDAGNIAAVCLAVNSQYINLSAALRLASDYGAKQMTEVPLFVRQIESEGWSALADDLSGQSQGVYRVVHSFGLLQELCKQDALKQERLNAQACALHDAYLAANQPLNPAKASHKSWDELEWLFRQSNRNAADHIRVKLRTLGLDWADTPSGTPMAFNPSAEEKVMLAKLEHCRWVVEKELFNSAPGEKTDYDQKIHTCMVEWDTLSDTEKKKDIDQITALAEALRAGGYKIVKDTFSDEC